MKKIMCLLVFLAVASMSMAVIAPVTSVVKTDAAAVPPSTYARKLLQSITVGADTFSLLNIGTTTQNNVLVPAMNDMDLNTAFTGFGTYVSKTVLFGGTNYVSTNGNKPDFFFFEATATTGNPETCSVAAIFPDDTVGTYVAVVTPASWGNTGFTVVGAVNNTQRIFGTSFDITDLKTAAGAALASNAIIKGIAIGPVGAGIDPIGLFAAARVPERGEATTPVPTNGNNQVDGKTLTQVSWSAPVDPNIVSVTGYDVWFETHEPNDLVDTRKSTNQPGQSYSVSLSSSTTYYWRVDTYVTWIAGPPTVVKGPVWQFTTLPPVLTFKNVVTTLALSPAALSATVTGNTSPITSVLFELLPPGGATLTDTTTDYQNPTATLATTSTTDVTYQVKLTVSGATPQPMVKTVNVKFYADACAARKDASLTPAWAANYYDRDSSCLVNTSDLLVYVTNWLNDTTMKTQATYVKAVTVLALDIVVECENAYAPTDPNYTTEAPLEENVGSPRISSNGLASGEKMIDGFNVPGYLLTYQVVVPQTGAYTLYVRSWHEWTRAVSFDIVTSVSPDGDPSNDILTNLTTMSLPSPGAGSAWYLDSKSPVNLTAGTYLIRLTKTDQWDVSPDFFGFKKNF